MKKHHTSIVLATLFLTGLVVLWWADYTGVESTGSDAVLPQLEKVPLADIKRLEIVQPEAAGEEAGAGKSAAPVPAPRRLVFERRDEGRWQMIEPRDVAANPPRVETLARNLKELRKSPDAGTIQGPSATFGLAPPAAVVRVYGGGKTPLAGLEVGRSRQEQLYVRAEGTQGIEVVNPRLLAMLTTNPTDWRDTSLFHLPSFRVGSIRVAGPGRDLTLERDEGHWRLARPFVAAAEDAKVEGLLAELSSLQVVKTEPGFVADDVKAPDAAKYGLDPPELTIELRPVAGAGKSQTLLVGKPRDESSGLSYARAGDQDDVVLVDAKNFRNLGRDVNALRSKTLVELTPARVEFLRVEAFGTRLDVSRTADGWRQVRPTRETADSAAVVGLLRVLGEAESSEFLDPAGFPRAGLNPPRMTISVWQAAEQARPAIGLEDPPQAAPRLVLEVGNHDAGLKAVFAHVPGDRSLLALTEAFANALPRTPLAFHDRTLLKLEPAEFLRLAIERGGTTYVLVAPTAAGTANQWRMTAPAEAVADQEAVTRAVLVLSGLRADGYVSDQVGDGKAFGLDRPVLRATWTVRAKAPAAAAAATATGAGTSPEAKGASPGEETTTGTLRVGARLPGGERAYANIEGSPVVFTLGDEVVKIFEDEFHTRRVLAFGADSVRHVLLRWPGRSLALKPHEMTPGGAGGQGVRWVPELGEDATGFDTTRIGALVGDLAKLVTPRFIQYDGPIQAATGLRDPRLVIELQFDVGREPQVLRLGGPATKDLVFATTARGDAGPVFLLAGAAWSDLIEHPPGARTLPTNVFTPPPAAAGGADAGSKRP
jgi:hypothetical protein